MAESAAFEWASAEIEKATDLDRLAARGTLRIVLRGAGLEAGAVTGDQLAVAVGKVMPAELASRGIHDAERICQGIAGALASVDLAEAGARTSDPEAVFRRLGGD